MRLESRDYKCTKLVNSKYSNKSWIVNSKGERISEKFKVKCELQYGPYITVNTDKGKCIYHKDQDGIVFWSNSSEVYLRKISEKLYALSWYSQNTTEPFIRIYDDRGKVVHREVAGVNSLHNGLIAVKMNEYWGFMDENGTVVIPPTWAEVENFNDYGYSIVRFKEGRRIAVIDKSGSYVLGPSDYSKLEFISEDLIIAVKDNKKGLITLKGKVIIPCDYDDIYVREDYYIVYIKPKYGLFDAEGNVIFECIYPEIIETPDKFVVQDFIRQEAFKQKEVAKSN